MKKNNKVLITGVAGFIGSNLLDYLLEKTTWNISGIDNFSTGQKNNIEGNLNNPRFNFINDSSLHKYLQICKYRHKNV